ncbi:single-stranded-DNA-specific exonuclease RecJ [Kallotenue papyrolyticum]|uniref:single-stranded-DNA-specific exonuclease RecJ n=1 Tax=Kallotenue papyrolyticum TaxID=1325125 RepID=UPI00046E9385|nr:single-stranded-DNA-specific exonuclease RecJ [Kallotenue papyrolyticum]
MPHARRWIPRPAAPADFLEALPSDLLPPVGQVLWNRGVTDAAAVAAFLAADYRHQHDPFALRDMERAVQRIRQARDAGETVAIYGDFDTDGVTGVALLRQALSGLGLRVIPYIPHRIEEGYGLNLRAVEHLAQQAQVLITVDCGISNVAEVARAQALGLDVIVLDHHTPPPTLPQGYAVINPKRPGCTYPYKMLAGVGVAYKLVQALYRAGLRAELRGRDLLDMVALGTVTDVAPLDGENRVLVKHGLTALNASQRPGLRALIEVAASRRPLDARAIAFQLGPRLNAAGRLDDAIRAYRLLLAESQAEAQRLAHELNQINLQRQRLTHEALQLAIKQILALDKHRQRVIVHDGADFPAGIIGLVAARLVEHFGRPVVLLERGAVTSRGSARSIADFSIIDALNEIGDLFEKFGGHAMAAGMTIATARLPELEARLQAVAMRTLPEELLQPRLLYDGELALEQPLLALAEQLRLLEPFGHGNPEPVWITRGLRVLDARAVGREGSHLKLRLSDGRQVVDAVWWGQGALALPLAQRPCVDVAYHLALNEFLGVQRVQWIVKDLIVQP